jgi:DnaK suppressor protein
VTLFERNARDRLLERRERLVERLAAAALRVRSAAARGGVVADDANEARRQMFLELAAVDRALAHLTLGTFGVCERCGRALGTQRLRADPEARWCLECTDVQDSKRAALARALSGAPPKQDPAEVTMAAQSPSTVPISHQLLERLFGQVVEEARKDDRSALRTLWARFEQEVRDHIRIEEAELLPGYSRQHAEDAAAIRRDHAYFDRVLTEFGVDLDLHLVRETAVEEFGSRLRAHAEAEQRGLYPWAEREPGVMDRVRRGAPPS